MSRLKKKDDLGLIIVGCLVCIERPAQESHIPILSTLNTFFCQINDLKLFLCYLSNTQCESLILLNTPLTTPRPLATRPYREQNLFSLKNRTTYYHRLAITALWMLIMLIGRTKHRIIMRPNPLFSFKEQDNLLFSLVVHSIQLLWDLNHPFFKNRTTYYAHWSFKAPNYYKI